jgi:hypothetical protein
LRSRARDGADRRSRMGDMGHCRSNPVFTSLGVVLDSKGRVLMSGIEDARYFFLVRVIGLFLSDV